MGPQGGLTAVICPSGLYLMNKATLLNVGGWALALGAFGVGMFLSYRGTHYSKSNDLRTPAVLLLNAFLGTAVA